MSKKRWGWAEQEQERSRRARVASESVLPCMSIRQPWAWAIASGCKPVENRTWLPPGGLLGRRIGIAATAKAPRPEEVEELRRICLDVPRNYVLGSIVAVATLVGAKRLDKDYSPSGYVGDPEKIAAWDREHAGTWEIWATGPVCWLLSEVFELPKPVPCKGMIGIWDLPSAELSEVQAQSPPASTVPRLFIVKGR